LGILESKFTMPSPPKPWEKTGAAPRAATVSNNGVTATNTTVQQQSTTIANDVPPAIPARPSSMSSGFANRGKSFFLALNTLNLIYIYYKPK
jgi:hypothetical protein